MGEQMLSREYYYLGTQLPVDRFLTFYYGHPGFHINHILVIYSIQVFMVTRKSILLSCILVNNFAYSGLHRHIEQAARHLQSRFTRECGRWPGRML